MVVTIHKIRLFCCSFLDLCTFTMNISCEMGLKMKKKREKNETKIEVKCCYSFMNFFVLSSIWTTNQGVQINENEYNFSLVSGFKFHVFISSYSISCSNGFSVISSSQQYCHLSSISFVILFDSIYELWANASCLFNKLYCHNISFELESIIQNELFQLLFAISCCSSHFVVVHFTTLQQIMNA